MDELLPIIAILTIFVGMPLVILHYMTQWKRMRTLSDKDETLLDDLYDTARALEDRLTSVERILDAESADWRPHHHRQNRSGRGSN